MTRFPVLVLAVLACSFCGSSAEENTSGNTGDTAKDDDDSDMYMESVEDQKDASTSHQQAQNRFFPSFARFEPPRNFDAFRQERGFQQERAYSQKPASPFQQVGFGPPFKYSGFKDDFKEDFSIKNSQKTHGLLGDGNFGVIAGGTFYPEKDNEAEGSFEGYSSYYHNGHAGPSNSFYLGSGANPRPYQHEQFANFRDFADINAPADRQYSEYVVVYVNKNDTKKETAKTQNKPKNIIESLQMLDLETTTTTEVVPEKKLSKSKRKLSKLLPEKKYKVKLTKKEKMKELREPLLALS